MIVREISAGGASLSSFSEHGRSEVEHVSTPLAASSFVLSEQTRCLKRAEVFASPCRQEQMDFASRHVSNPTRQGPIWHPGNIRYVHALIEKDFTHYALWRQLRGVNGTPSGSTALCTLLYKWRILKYAIVELCLALQLSLPLHFVRADLRVPCQSNSGLARNLGISWPRWISLENLRQALRLSCLPQYLR